jgi:hypothetical protein
MNKLGRLVSSHSLLSRSTRKDCNAYSVWNRRRDESWPGGGKAQLQAPLCRIPDLQAPIELLDTTCALPHGNIRPRPSDRWADFVLSKDFDLEHLIRLIIELLHICTDHEGDFDLHEVDPATSPRPSHNLCGPVAHVSASFKHLQISKASLHPVLSLLRDYPSCEHTNKYVLEQAVLLPTVIMASIRHERCMENCSATEQTRGRVGVQQ